MEKRREEQVGGFLSAPCVNRGLASARAQPLSGQNYEKTGGAGFKMAPLFARIFFMLAFHRSSAAAVCRAQGSYHVVAAKLDG